MNNVKAFTVMEFSIAMVLTAILASLGYSALGLFTRQTVQHTSNGLISEKIQVFQFLLHKDFVDVDCIRVDQNKVIAENYNGQIMATYAFDESSIIRESSTVHDTLIADHIDLKCTLGLLPVSSGMADQLLCTVNADKRQFALAATKVYSAVDKMKMNRPE
jgi:competence protein ComGF